MFVVSVLWCVSVLFYAVLLFVFFYAIPLPYFCFCHPIQNSKYSFPTMPTLTDPTGHGLGRARGSGSCNRGSPIARSGWARLRASAITVQGGRNRSEAIAALSALMAADLAWLRAIQATSARSAAAVSQLAQLTTKPCKFAIAKERCNG